MRADRFPVLFSDTQATQERFGVIWPKGFDFDMIVDELPEGYGGNVISQYCVYAIHSPWTRSSFRLDNYSLDRKMCRVDLWRTYIETGVPPPGFAPDPSSTPHHRIMNMSCLEISNTPLADRIHLPFLQRECDPVVRFSERLKDYEVVQGSLYVLSTKAGSFTVRNSS
jgi:hypothetical protein